MARYRWHVSAGAGGTTRTTLIQITPGAGTTIEVTRIWVSTSGVLAAADNTCRVELIRMTTASTGGTTQTATKFHPNDRAASSTLKDDTSAFTFGTAGDIALTRDFNQRGAVEWVPREDESKIESGIAGAIELVITQSAAFAVDADMEWEE